MKIQKSGEWILTQKKWGSRKTQFRGGVFASFLRYFWLGNCHRKKNIKPVVE